MLFNASEDVVNPSLEATGIGLLTSKLGQTLSQLLKDKPEARFVYEALENLLIDTMIANENGLPKKLQSVKEWLVYLNDQAESYDLPIYHANLKGLKKGDVVGPVSEIRKDLDGSVDLYLGYFSGGDKNRVFCLQEEYEIGGSGGALTDNLDRTIPIEKINRCDLKDVDLNPNEDCDVNYHVCQEGHLLLARQAGLYWSTAKINFGFDTGMIIDNSSIRFDEVSHEKEGEKVRIGYKVAAKIFAAKDITGE